MLRSSTERCLKRGISLSIPQREWLVSGREDYCCIVNFNLKIQESFIVIHMRSEHHNIFILLIIKHKNTARNHERKQTSSNFQICDVLRLQGANLGKSWLTTYFIQLEGAQSEYAVYQTGFMPKKHVNHINVHANYDFLEIFQLHMR